MRAEGGDGNENGRTVLALLCRGALFFIFLLAGAAVWAAPDKYEVGVKIPSEEDNKRVSFYFGIKPGTGAGEGEYVPFSQLPEEDLLAVELVSPEPENKCREAVDQGDRGDWYPLNSQAEEHHYYFIATQSVSDLRLRLKLAGEEKGNKDGNPGNESGAAGERIWGCQVKSSENSASKIKKWRQETVNKNKNVYPIDSEKCKSLDFYEDWGVYLCSKKLSVDAIDASHIIQWRER